MTCQKISIFEHQACEISLKIPNENIGDWLCYGSAIRKGYQECIHFNVEPDTVKNNFKITIPSIDVKSAALKFELYEYQIFLKNINSHQEFLVISGEIEVKKRTCIHDAEGAISDTSIELEATISETSINVDVNIAGGLSAYQIAKLHGYGGAEKEWIAELEGAAAAANAAKISANDAQLSLAASLEAQDKCQEDTQKSENFKNETFVLFQSTETSTQNALDAAVAAQASALIAEQSATDANNAKIASETIENKVKVIEEAIIIAQNAVEKAAADALTSQITAEEQAAIATAAAEAARDGALVAQAGADAVRFDLLPLTLDWLESRFTASLGEGNFTMTLNDDETVLTMVFALDTTEAQIAEVESLLERILPRNLVTEMYWADGFPMNYTRLEYLESTGTQWMITDFVPNNESGVRALYINNSGNSVHPIVTAETVDGNKRGFSVATTRSSSTMTCVWGTQRDPSGTGASNTAIIEGQTNYLNSRTIIWHNRETNNYLKRFIKTGAVYPDYPSPLSYTPTVPFHFCKSLWYGGNVNFSGKLLEARFSQGEHDACIFVPALDDTGVPCMYDLLARKACRNSGSGQFKAGVETMEQLDAVLRGLPDYTGQDGGELHLRLSDTLYETAVASGIIEETATTKNWQIAYNPTTEIAA